MTLYIWFPSFAQVMSRSVINISLAQDNDV
jgi:hypothetical protein